MKGKEKINNFKRIILMLTVVGGFVMCGCSKSEQEQVKEALKEKYGEEFLVYSVDTKAWYGDNYHAYVAPVNNEEVVFEAVMYGEKLTGDDYVERYAAKLINDILKDDLEEFFPGAYIKTEVQKMANSDRITDLTNISLEDIIINSEGAGEMMVEIYYDGKVGTNRKYVDEYTYFTDEMDEYINKNQMFPITIEMYKVEGNTIKKLQEYFKSNILENSSFEKDVLGVSHIKLNNLKNDGTGDDLGIPYNISACFNRNYTLLDSCEEYIRRRELIENAE